MSCGYYSGPWRHQGARQRSSGRRAGWRPLGLSAGLPGLAAWRAGSMLAPLGGLINLEQRKPRDGNLHGKLLLLAPCLGWRCEGASPSGQAVFNSRYTSVQKDEPTRQGPVSLLSWIPGRGASMADGVEIHGLTGRAQTLRDGGLSRAQGSMKLEPPAVGQAGNGSPPLGHAMCRRPPCFPPTRCSGAMRRFVSAAEGRLSEGMGTSSPAQGLRPSVAQ